MKRKITFLIGILALWFVVGCSSDDVGIRDEKNDLISKTLISVSKENIYRTVEDLQKFRTRYSWEKQDEVANYLFKRFQGFGIPVEFDEYDFKKKKWKNVIATIDGKKEAGAIYMVIAHFDSISEKPEVSAPGADDNGSGTAALLEIGRILGQAPPDATVKLAIFSNEEQGASGSRHYARKARERNLDIRGVLNLDVIGYNTPMANETSQTPEARGVGNGIKWRLKTMRNRMVKFLHPDGLVIVAGRTANQGLVKEASALMQKYSRLSVKAKVDQDCG